MKYPEKLQLSKIIYKDFLKGYSFENVKDKLKNQGLYENEINEVIISAKRMLLDKFDDRKNDIIIYNYDKNDKKFLGLNEDVFNSIKEIQIKNHIVDIKKKIKIMVNKEMSDNEIISKINSPIYDNNFIIEIIKSYEISNLNKVKPHNELFSISGRINRKTYFIEFLITIGGILSFFRLSRIKTNNALEYIYNNPFSNFWIVLIYVLIIVFLMQVIKRLHDIDISGWFIILFVLLFFVPYFGFFGLMYTFFTKGSNGANKYGPDPNV